jgi:predicted nucleotide-binding protein
MKASLRWQAASKGFACGLLHPEDGGFRTVASLTTAVRTLDSTIS